MLPGRHRGGGGGRVAATADGEDLGRAQPAVDAAGDGAGELLEIGVLVLLKRPWPWEDIQWQRMLRVFLHVQAGPHQGHHFMPLSFRLSLVF